ncbi:Phage small terminase subunit [Variovorax sp. OK605]|uniref:phage terminase small subunit n=1 Tax=Variovorax sp. OK605 TaxID=1855317 RepID=UPI0008DF51B4|nr:phage terminase small subunit [Variovorax sp. OK605]SFO51741.1 Phage small terminase subunit [Variovorax sp. OK605]
MRQTPAQRHLERKLAVIAVAAAPAGGEPQGTAYELGLVQLAEHRRRLKDIQSIERKIEAKRQFLPEYDAWIDSTLEAGSGGQDVIFTTVLVWHIDAGNYARALQMAPYAIAHGLQMPDQYDRSLGTVLIDEFGGAALSGKMTLEEARDMLPQVLACTDALDAPDQARAKLHKALGYAFIGRKASGDVDYDAMPLPAVAAGLNNLQRALNLYDQVGVKKDIERLERRLRNSSNAAPPAP